MSHKAFSLPPVRELIVPDKGHMIVDVDLSGADAQVVAWEAQDEDLKTAFRKGMKIHVKNFEDFYQTKFEDKYKKTVAPGHLYPPYDEMKRSVHATNYGASARTVAITLQWKVAEAEAFQRRWFQLHPGIKQWHRRTEQEVQRTGTIRNRFGYRIVYFERPSEVLSEALAWTPQSTVGIICARGAVKLHRNIPWATILMQVHDSIIFQLPYHRFTPASLRAICDNITIPVPYPDPLTIPWGIKASDRNWGACKDCTWQGEFK
jgi:DNA polymerase-1